MLSLFLTWYTFSIMNTKTFLKVVAKVTVLSVIGNVILTLAGRAISMPPETFAPYTYPPVIGLTVVGILAGAVVYYAMRKKYTDTAKANRHFMILSAIVLLASFYPDLALPWSTDADEVGWTFGIMANLMLMHVVTGGLVMYYFTRKDLA